MRAAAWLLFSALLVLLVPSSAWSVDTALPGGSDSLSSSAGSSSPSSRLRLQDPASPSPEQEPSASESTPPPSPPESASPSSSPPPPSPSSTGPETFSPEQLDQLDQQLQQFALDEEGNPTCGTGELPPCEVRLAPGQFSMFEEGAVAGVVALSVLLLVALVRLIGGWGRRER